jgi:hypothetical protein
MTHIVLKYGVYSGLVSALLMAVTVPFIEQIFEYGAFVGYTGMLVSFLFVYFGVRAYRDTVLAGHITFTTAFNVGILITLVSCLFYVAAWLVVYYQVMPDFPDRYARLLADSLQAKGAAQEEVAAALKQGEAISRMYANPLMNAAITFTEPFPVGLLVTLVSAATLRKKAS